MSLPRSYRRLDALRLLLVTIFLASNAQAFNVSAGTVNRRTEPVEIERIPDTTPLPERAPLNADTALFTEEAQIYDDAQVFDAGHNTRGQCWKLPARATLAVFDAQQNAGHSLRRPAIFWMNIKAMSNAPAVTRVRALRPVCLMPLPFTPDRKNNARQLAAMQQPTFKAS